MSHKKSDSILFGGAFATIVAAAINPVAGWAVGAAAIQAYRKAKAEDDANRKAKVELSQAQFKASFYRRQKWASYEDYLTSEVWATKRDSILAQANRVCGYSDCAAPATEVHHRWYPRVWGQERPDSLVALCHLCHMAIHTDEKRFPAPGDQK